MYVAPSKLITTYSFCIFVMKRVVQGGGGGGGVSGTIHGRKKQRITDHGYWNFIFPNHENKYSFILFLTLQIVFEEIKIDKEITKIRKKHTLLSCSYSTKSVWRYHNYTEVTFEVSRLKITQNKVVKSRISVINSSSSRVTQNLPVTGHE